MFYGCCSLQEIDLSSFNSNKANILCMFDGFTNLISCGNADKKIEDKFKNRSLFINKN